MNERDQQALRATVSNLLQLGEVAAAAGLEGPEAPVLRFGDVAVALGFTTRFKVRLALEEQRLDREEGRPHRLVGQILQDRGWLSEEQCARVMDALTELVRARRGEVTLVDRLSA